ncbi:MAG TPA: hypothetical protein VMS60_13275 [Solirubrobacterales bacterium]|nr:hypothetical protein [Solirubrobacterales bacterium]
MASGKAKKPSRYAQIIERVFLDNHKRGAREVEFSRTEFASVAKTLGIKLPSNLGDILYSFRYRHELPRPIVKRQPRGLEWAIFPAQYRPAAYKFVAVPFSTISPTPGKSVTKIPDATPGLIDLYRKTDEQALLAKLRYNRLLDIYSGVTTYSLQSHMRTTIPESQIETDEVYVGVDRRGRHYVFPVQAKGGKNFLSIVQIWQDFKMCEAKFDGLIPRPIAAQFMADDVIAVFSFDWDGKYGITIKRGSERHYKLVQSPLR